MGEQQPQAGGPGAHQPVPSGNPDGAVSSPAPPGCQWYSLGTFSALAVVSLSAVLTWCCPPRCPLGQFSAHLLQCHTCGKVKFLCCNRYPVCHDVYIICMLVHRVGQMLSRLLFCDSGPVVAETQVKCKESILLLPVTVKSHKTSCSCQLCHCYSTWQHKHGNG